MCLSWVALQRRLAFISLERLGIEDEVKCSEVVGFKTIQLGRRMSCEHFGRLWLMLRAFSSVFRMLRSFGIIEEDPEVYMPLRRMREEWLVTNIRAASWLKSS